MSNLPGRTRLKRWSTSAGLSCVVLFVLGVYCPNLPAAEAGPYPISLVVSAGPPETLFVADRNLPGVWKVVDGKASIYFKADKKLGSPLNAVRTLALDLEGNLLAGDSASREVYRFNKAGKPEGLTGGEIGLPIALAVGLDGSIYAADLELHRILKIPAAGGAPVELVKLQAPRGMTSDAAGNLLVVTHGKDLLVRVLTAESADAKTRLQTVIAGQPLPRPAFPAGIALHPTTQEAFLADGYNKTIWRITKENTPEKFAQDKPLVHPVALAFRGETLCVLDPRSQPLGMIELNSAGEPTIVTWKTE